MNDRIFRFEAPEGKLYDWAEPRFAYIKDKDGNETQEQEHLYAKYLCLGQFDLIDNYILVDAPQEG